MLLKLISLLIPALMQVESHFDPNAIGDEGRAVGILQITPICVQDVNRFSDKFYIWDDRKDVNSSVNMCYIYLAHYGEKYKQETGNDATLEVLARMWNGGPIGWKKESTVHYWAKVQAALEEQQANRLSTLQQRFITPLPDPLADAIEQQQQATETAMPTR